VEPMGTEPPPVHSRGRLVRTRDDRVIAGVCGGVGRYLGIDPVLVRVAAVLLVLLAGTGLLAYVIAWIVMPEETVSPTGSSDPPDAGTSARAEGDGDRTGAVIFGLVLVVIGGLLLLDRAIPVLSWKYIGPLLLIVIGVTVLARGGVRR
jgi:phage shock protein C